MKFVQYQDCISPHQVPLAKELVKRLGAENFRYVYRDKAQEERVRMGWSMGETEPWFVHIASHPEEASNLIENADILLSGMRDVDLWLRRAEKGLTTFVQSERWFKPITLFDLRLFDCSIPGWVRMLHPRYRRMTQKVRKWLISDPHARYLAIGPWAANDMRRIGVPDTKIVPWGYFVEPSTVPPSERPIRPNDGILRLLYVGRLIPLKRVDTILRALRYGGKAISPVHLTIVGDGPERVRLEKLAQGLPVTFLGTKPITEIRPIMRQHDILIFTSTGLDGWGAVVSEALEEGCKVVGTYETGASAAILPPTNLFHADDYKALARILSETIPSVDASQWTAAAAVEKLLKMYMV